MRKAKRRQYARFHPYYFDMWWGQDYSMMVLGCRQYPGRLA